uniref:Putative secreted protein n=1 Tax=Anopheles darlingi TaxID=43151 RepID=A0A2M4D5F2_ANODA
MSVRVVGLFPPRCPSFYVLLCALFRLHSIPSVSPRWCGLKRVRSFGIYRLSLTKGWFLIIYSHSGDRVCGFDI